MKQEAVMEDEVNLDKQLSDLLEKQLVSCRIPNNQVVVFH